VKQLKVKKSDSSYFELVKIARKCGFLIKQGSKHCIVKTQDGQKITTIPRHNPIRSRETITSIVKSFNNFCDNKIDLV